MEYKLASHQTMSYGTPRRWWMWVVDLCARCQDKSLVEQIRDAGVEMIDIRIRFGSSFIPHFAHGLVEYTEDVFVSLGIADSCARQYRRKIMVRLMHEERKPTEEARCRFAAFCRKVEKDFPNLVFFGGMNRYDWSDVVYDFGRGTMDSAIDERVSSVRSLGLFPYLWAKINNGRILRQGTDKEFLMMDFL